MTTLNKGLLVLAIIVILAGVAFEAIPLILFGVFLLFPSLYVPRKIQRPASTPPERPRVQKASPSLPQPELMPAQTGQMRVQAREDRALTSTFPSLFPTTLFPTLNPVQPVKSEAVASPEDAQSRDELFDIVAVMGILSLLSKRRR